MPNAHSAPMVTITAAARTPHSTQSAIGHGVRSTTGDWQISHTALPLSVNQRLAHAACASPSVPMHLHPRGRSGGSSDRHMRHSCIARGRHASLGEISTLPQA